MGGGTRNASAVTFPPFEHRHPATRIVSGQGSVRRLAELLDDLDGRRALAVCGRTIGAGPQLRLVREALGGRLVGVFDRVRPQGEVTLLEQAAALVREVEADVLVSVGGGSTMDSAKCIALMLARDAPLEEYRVSKSEHGHAPGRPVPPTIPHIAIPTTAGSSSEIMPWAGIRDAATRTKMLFRDDALVPSVAILDPEVLVWTGPELTATSGVTAIARSVEALYSRERQPLADAYALKALELMTWALPRAVADGADLDARSATQIGALMSGIAADNAMASLVHAVGHAVGGRHALQHGVAHGILLPPVAERCLRFAGEARTAVSLALGCEATGDPEADGALAVQALAALLESLPTPNALREVGVAREELPDLAGATVADPMFAASPLPLGIDDVLEILAAAW